MAEKIPWGASRNDRGTEKKEGVMGFGEETGMKRERENGRTKKKSVCYSCTKISR